MQKKQVRESEEWHGQAKKRSISSILPEWHFPSPAAPRPARFRSPAALPAVPAVPAVPVPAVSGLRMTSEAQMRADDPSPKKVVWMVATSRHRHLGNHMFVGIEVGESPLQSFWTLRPGIGHHPGRENGRKVASM